MRTWAALRAIFRGVALGGAIALSAACQTLGGGSDTAGAEARPFQDDDDFRKWFAFYYERPQPERVPNALAFMSKRGYLSNHPDIASVFFGKVFAANPDRLDDWVAQWGSLGDSGWSVVMVALWLADVPEAKRLIADNARRLPPTHRERFAALVAKDPRRAEVLANDVTDPRQINLLWAAFSATGDERYVRKVVSYVPLYGGLPGEDEGSTSSVVGEAAIVTLANNVPYHAIVERVCQDENRSNPNPKTRLLLQAMFNVLADVQRERGSGAPAH